MAPYIDEALLDDPEELTRKDSRGTLRALAVAGIRSMGDLERWTEQDLLALHGMGPKACGILRDALATP